MQDYFNDLSDKLLSQCKSNEFLLLNLIAESSDFVRINNNLVRQAGNVKQACISLQLINGLQHASASCDLVGELEQDLTQLQKYLVLLREQIPILPEDPYLYYSTNIVNSVVSDKGVIPPAHDIIDYVMMQANGLDLVGVWASGDIVYGFANTRGQRNWFNSSNFNFDWSVYHSGDKAVKMDYAGFNWDKKILADKIMRCTSALEVIAKPSKFLKPGRYRVFLAPTALNEIMDIVSWGGFGLKSHRTAQSSLIKMVEEGRTLASSIDVKENHAGGLSPGFTFEGFSKPDSVTLIETGQYKDCLVNSRSAKEYGQAVNSASEIPGSIELSAGSLATGELLKQLDTGIYINNLWYCNYSDRTACRITGMTRYACFWVENGEIVAPIGVMRFDESIYNLLGKNLVGLSEEREYIFDSSSYHNRSTDTAHLPGILVDDFTLTL